MIKQLLTIIFVAIAFFGQASAQKTHVDSIMASKKTQHQLSVNATFFIKQFLNFSTSNLNIQPSPYLFDYRMMIKQKHGWRMSLGGNWAKSNNQISTTQVQVSDELALNYRVGYLYNIPITRRWNVCVGADVIGQISNSFTRNNTTFDIVTTRTNGFSLGAGPATVIQFNINQRLALFTETGVYYTNNHQKTKTLSQNFEEFNGETKSLSSKIEFIIPVSLFFSVKF